MNNSNGTSGNKIEGPPPVFKLANDLLAEIFLMNATRSDCQPAERVATTLISSRICRIWRSVALGYRMLWLHMIDYDNDSLAWIDEMLRRSDPALFDFGSRDKRVDVSEDRRGVLDLVFNYSSRLRTFRLQTPIGNWELLRSRFLQKPAPNLEFIDACVLFDDEYVKIDFCVLFDNECVLTDPLFDNHAPSLRHFQLRRCAVDFTSPVLTLLTELYVRQITVLDAAPTIAAWLHVLGGMPFIQRITIIDAISNAAVAQTEFPIIHLVHLGKLSVEGGFHECVTLINQVITPPRCGLMVRCNHAHFGPEQKILWAMIAKKLDFWDQDSIARELIAELHVDMESFSIGNLKDILSSWEDNEAEELEFHSPSDPFLAVSLHSHNSEDLILLFISLFGLFEPTFPGTTYLTLNLDYALAEGNGLEVFRPLVEYFRSFVKLDFVTLVDDSHEYILPHLQRISSHGSVFVPVLDEVHFAGAVFRRLSNLTVVVEFLQWRREQGCPIQEIHLYDCHIDLDLVPSLLQVGDVKVTMGTNYTDDTDDDEDPDADDEDPDADEEEDIDMDEEEDADPDGDILMDLDAEVVVDYHYF
ncbi:hypothetical protein BYT27DRAFT_6697993 [Phlegmacium glaucopus]|nr:hypothetical protein BYT27DRAFT_6697993 [Phlegmacium glaucopus]